MKTLKPLAKAKNLVINGYSDGSFSISNSPYYGHKTCSAIDLYPDDRELPREVSSPVEGTVTALRRFSPPTSIYFKNPEFEYVIIIENSANPDLCYKILHAEPKVSIGQKISLGDNLGKFIRSGLFCFWTDPHIHLEIRNKTDPIRARGAYQLQLISQKELTENQVEKDSSSCLSGEVVESKSEYIVIKPSHELFASVDGFYGLKVKVNGQTGILDGGIPHYGHGGVLLTDTQKINQNDVIYFGDVRLGVVTGISANNYLHFQCGRLSITNKFMEFQGISSYLKFKRPKGIKLVPKTPQKHCIKLGQTMEIEIK